MEDNRKVKCYRLSIVETSNGFVVGYVPKMLIDVVDDAYFNILTNEKIDEVVSVKKVTDIFGLDSKTELSFEDIKYMQEKISTEKFKNMYQSKLEEQSLSN